MDYDATSSGGNTVLWAIIIGGLVGLAIQWALMRSAVEAGVLAALRRHERRRRREDPALVESESARRRRAAAGVGLALVVLTGFVVGVVVFAASR